MAFPRDSRSRCFDLYVNNRLPLTTIAEQTGIPFRTISRWKQQAAKTGLDWEQARAARALTSDGIKTAAQIVLEDYLIQHKATLDALREPLEPIGPLQRAEVLSRLSDSFHKAMAAHAKLSPELSRLAVAMDVMQKLAGFLRTHYPQHVEAFLEVLEPFGEELSQVYG